MAKLKKTFFYKVTHTLSYVILDGKVEKKHSFIKVTHNLSYLTLHEKKECFVKTVIKIRIKHDFLHLYKKILQMNYIPQSKFAYFSKDIDRLFSAIFEGAKSTLS